MSFGDFEKNAPKVLALETSTASLGVAVLNGQDLLAETVLHMPKAHSTMLLPLCVEALERSGVPLRQLSCIAVSKGPGSFTGLRIGVATAQGLAVSLGKRIVMVPSFEVMLYQARHLRHVVIASGRAKAQAASAGYSRLRNAGDGDLNGPYGFKETIPALPRDLDDLFEEVRKIRASEVHVTGDAALDLVAMGSSRKKGPRLTPIEPYWRLPRPGVLGLIAARMFLDGMATDPRDALPEYFRKSQAEVLSGAKTALRVESAGEGQ